MRELAGSGAPDQAERSHQQPGDLTGAPAHLGVVQVDHVEAGRARPCVLVGHGARLPTYEGTSGGYLRGNPWGGPPPLVAPAGALGSSQVP